MVYRRFSAVAEEHALMGYAPANCETFVNGDGLVTGWNLWETLEIGVERTWGRVRAAFRVQGWCVEKSSSTIALMHDSCSLVSYLVRWIGTDMVIIMLESPTQRA
jgi:hypothetical protein